MKFHHSRVVPFRGSPVALSRNSLLLFAASWLLLAVFLLPAQASAAAGPALQYPDMIPLADNTITIGEAPLAWLETAEEIGITAKDIPFRCLTEVAASP